MGFRFRKSKNLGNFRLNLSKSGIGYSYGEKGFRRTHKAGGGTRTTMSIPGTGISHVTETGKPKKKRGAFVWIIMLAFLPITLLVLFLKSDKIKMPKKKRYLAVAITMVAIVIFAAIAGATSPGEEPEPSPDVREIQEEASPVESDPKTQEPDVKTQESEHKQQDSEVKTQEPDVKTQEQEEICGVYVFVSASGDGSKYHMENCRTIRNSETAKLTIAEAESRGFTPCGVCHPK